MLPNLPAPPPVTFTANLAIDATQSVSGLKDALLNAKVAFKELEHARSHYGEVAEAYGAAMAELDGEVAALARSGLEVVPVLGAGEQPPPAVEEPAADFALEAGDSTPTGPEDEGKPRGGFESPKVCRKKAKVLVYEKLEIFFNSRQKYGIPLAGKESFETEDLLIWVEATAKGEKWYQELGYNITFPDDEIRGRWATWFREVLDAGFKPGGKPRTSECFQPYKLTESVLLVEEIPGYRNRCRFTWKRASNPGQQPYTPEGGTIRTK